MKRKLLLILLLTVGAYAGSQTYQQTNIVLDSEIPKDKNLHYEASTSIKLVKGFCCHPDTQKSVVFSIDRYGVFPPDEGVIGGPPSSNMNGVVGALPGELNVSDLGAAVYSIPIKLPSGIGEITPQLAVTYNNQASNGLLGWGWYLSGLSSIVRTGQTVYHDGNQTAVNFVDDRFTLDGKRLMLCSGDYGGNGSVYKTEIDEMSKIVAFTDGYNGPARFVVHKKDGTIWEYGCTDDSRIEPQNRNDVVLMWLVNKITDPDGNYMTFSYIENQNTGESYINNIDYTLNDKAGIQSMYRVTFEYSDREDVEAGFVYASLVQNSKLLNHILIKNMMSGSILYDYLFDYLPPGNYSDDVKFMYHRLKSIGLTADGMSLNPTIISWNKKSHYPDKFLSYQLSKNMFNKVPFVGDFNGDGFTDVITVPYKISNSYSANVSASVFINNGDGSFNDNAFYTFTFDKTLEWLYVVDFDGDGLDDVVSYYANNDENASWKSKICAYINNGSGFSYIGEVHGNRYFTIYPGDFCGEKKTMFFLEYNNMDYSTAYYPAVVYYADNALVRQTLGYQSYFDVPERIQVEDVNGDGCSEILYLMENRSAVAQLRHESNGYSFQRLYYYNGFDSDDFLFPGDFNGDGYTDFLKYDNRTYWKVAYSDGESFTTPVPCMNNNLLRYVILVPQDRYYCSLENLSKPSVTIRTADFDGDGKTDVGVFKNAGGNYYLEIGFKMLETSNNYYGFSDIRRFYLNINYSHQYVHLGNFLGHENISVLSSVRENPYTNEIPKIVSLNPHTSKFSVERITDGLGNSHGFDYEYLMPKDNAFYHYDYQWIGEDLRTVTLPVRALRADTVFSTNNKPCITKYSYDNALYHTKGHGLLGFVKSESKLLINNVLCEKNVLEKDSEMMGDNNLLLPSKHQKYNYSDQLISEENYIYNKFICAQNDKIIMPLITTKKTTAYDYDTPGSVTKSNIENIDYQCDMTNTMYSDIVNVAEIVSGTDGNYMGDDAMACEFWQSTNYSYDNNVSEWIVSRLLSTQKSMHYEDNDAVGSCEIFEYSGANPYQITKKTLLPNPDFNYSDPLKVIAEYSYDENGHVIMQSLSTPSAKNQKVTRANYGEEYNYRYPTSIINENGWEINHSYNNDYGNLISTIDYNQFETVGESDPFEMTTGKTLSDGLKYIATKRWASDNKHAPQNAMYYCWEKTAGNAETMTFYSKNGKKLREVTFDLNGKPIYSDFTYDDFGNLISESRPYLAGDDAQTVYYVYDKNNRLIEEVYPDGLVKNYSYNKLQRTITTTAAEGASRSVDETFNPMGWRVQTIDIGENTINYSYYSDGKLKSSMLDDDSSTKVEYEYDNMRNPSKVKDPSIGETSRVYNAFGELMETTTAKHCVTSYCYDGMGNMISRLESDDNGQNVVSTQWIYDNSKGKIGLLSAVVYGDSHVVSYEYDALLRNTGVTETINGVEYTTNYTYDNAGREEIVTYPSGVTVKKLYSNSGCYRAMIDASNDNVLWKTDKADAAGYLTDYHVGNGLKTHREYDNKNKMLLGIDTRTDDKTYQNLSYSYDGFGNLISRTKLVGITKSESFVYDDFNRLVGIRLNNTVTGSMEYDDYGNILSKTIDNQEVFYEARYDGRSPYAVSKVKTDLDDLDGLSHNIEYTAFDKISQINSGKNSLSIDYGFDHERIRSIENVNGQLKTKVYVSDCEFVDSVGELVVYTFLKGPMGVFAVCQTDENQQHTMFYVHKDHLESWCLITDEDAQIVQKTSYDAWGNPRNDDTWSGEYYGKLLCDRGFTGHEHLSSFGIINMNGRAYDPLLSMMMSPDSYIQNVDFSQNYNRYIYCYNNPLSYSDSTGEWVEWLLYGAFNGICNVICNLDNIDNFAEGALTFGAGFVSGCLTQGLSGSSRVWQVVGNVSGKVLVAGTNNFVKQNKGATLDWSILENKSFKSDVMYALGSSLTTSILNTYVIKPVEKSDGKDLVSLYDNYKSEQRFIVTAAGRMAGNLFAGKNVLDELAEYNVSPYDLWLCKACLDNRLYEGFEFTTSSNTLGQFFDTLFNVNFSGTMREVGGKMNNCYSSIRSLFLKKG